MTFKKFLDDFEEGTVSGDISGTGDGFEKKIRKKKLPKEIEDEISEASDEEVTEALMDAAIRSGITVLGSFEERGIMTRDIGFEINYKNSTYQVTIVQSR